MACSCDALKNLSTACTPAIGGIRAITFKGAGSSTSAGDITVDILPESSSFQTVMTYDKTKNVKYWTTDVSMNIGAFVETTGTSPNEVIGTRDFSELLPCIAGWTIELATYDGRVITVSDAYIQTATFNSGTAKADGQSGVLAFQAITKDAPVVATPVTI